MGYTYPELQKGGTPTSVKQALNALYGASSGRTLHRRSQVKRMPRSIDAFGTLIRRVLGRSLPSSYEDAARDTYTEWIANLRVAQDALSSTFFIYVFLGDFKPDAACWSSDPNLVGMHTIFNSSPDLTKRHDLIVTGTIPLTRTLRRHAADGKLNLSDEKAVKDYLKANLHWRVTNVRGYNSSFPLSLPALLSLRKHLPRLIFSSINILDGHERRASWPSSPPQGRRRQLPREEGGEQLRVPDMG